MERSESRRSFLSDVTDEQSLAYPFADPARGPQDDVLRDCLRLAGAKDEKFRQSEEELAEIARDIDAMFDGNNLDALLVPGGLGAAGTRTISVATAKGYPIVSPPYLRILRLH